MNKILAVGFIGNMECYLNSKITKEEAVKNFLKKEPWMKKKEVVVREIEFHERFDVYAIDKSEEDF